MKPVSYAGLAVVSVWLALTTACGSKNYPADEAPAPEAEAPPPQEQAAQPAPDNAARAPDTAAVAAPVDSAPAAPPSMALEAGADGQSIFRFDTFGNEHYWTDSLRLHEVIEQKLDPTTALELGLKVDAAALPGGTLEGADLTSPATTLALLKSNAIVGIRALVDENNHITRVGITCALCHSTVDNSVRAGVGQRKDGWPNRDLNVGAIIALSPNVTEEERTAYNAWGKGKYDPRFNMDGKSHPVVIPPAYGLAKVENATYVAAGTIEFWNNYVAVTQMHGRGKFTDAPLGGHGQQMPMDASRDATQARDPMPMPTRDTVPAPSGGYPPPAGQTPMTQPLQHPAPSGDQAEDLVTPKLPALREYQHSLEVPAAPEGSFDAAAAKRGEAVFERRCASCHVGVTGTDNNGAAQASDVTPGGDAPAPATVKGKMHAPAETGMDPQYAERWMSGGYRTTPLRGLMHHAPYFHDGSAATLEDVVNHYEQTLKIRLTKRQKADLVEFLKQH
jgi:hypothetical protein